MFNRASSDVLPLVFMGYFLLVVTAHRQPRRPRPHQNGCAVNCESVTCPDTWSAQRLAWTSCDHRGVFKFLARDPEDGKEIEEARSEFTSYWMWVVSLAFVVRFAGFFFRFVTPLRCDFHTRQSPLVSRQPRLIRFYWKTDAVGCLLSS